jgi:hypothetical protein
VRQAQRTAVGDFRNLRQGIRARLARLNQYGGPDIGLTAPGGWPDRLRRNRKSPGEQLDSSESEGELVSGPIRLSWCGHLLRRLRETGVPTLRRLGYTFVQPK